MYIFSFMIYCIKGVGSLITSYVQDIFKQTYNLGHQLHTVETHIKKNIKLIV